MWSITNRHLCGLLSLYPQIPIQESYAFGRITPAEVIEFLGGVKQAIFFKVSYIRGHLRTPEESLLGNFHNVDNAKEGLEPFCHITCVVGP